MWLEKARIYYLFFFLQKKIKFLFSNSAYNSIYKVGQYLSFNWTEDTESLVDEIILVLKERKYFTLVHPNVDNVNEENISFIKTTLNKLNINYRENLACKEDGRIEIFVKE